MQVTFDDWGLGYKVALADVAIGLLMLVFSPLVGGIFYWGLTGALNLFGAPEGRTFLPPSEPETGTELLLLLGLCVLVAGVCVFCVRLVLELLELAGRPTLTRRLRPQGKLALGVAAAGAVVFAGGAIPLFVLSFFFVEYEYSFAGATSMLDAISQAGRLLMVCSLITLFMWGRGTRGALFRWADSLGWARVRCGWINRLAVAMLLGGIVSATFFFMLPFDDVAPGFATVGIAALFLGIVPQFLAGRRP